MLRALFVFTAWLAIVAHAIAEVPDRPKFGLVAAAKAIVVGTCESEAATTTMHGSMERTAREFVIRVERVERAESASLNPGDRIVVTSWNEAWKGSGLPPTYSAGHRQVPRAGDRVRVYLEGDGSRDASGRPRYAALFPNGWQPVARHVVFVGADDEYRSEITMPLLAAIGAREAGMTTTVAFPADPATGALDVDRRDHIANISTLQAADVAVFYMRWREFDDDSWKAVSTFLRSGQPIVGLRTTTHFLRTKDGTLDDELPKRVFGQRWISHHGHETRTRILVPEVAAAEHPILRGIRGNVVVPSWLYDVEPLPKDCRVLLYGEVVGRDGDTTKQPIVWIREAGPETPKPFPDGGTPARRMAFTTLGHPGDFENAEVRRLVVQMAVWAAGDEALIPTDGFPATLTEPYTAPPTR